MPSRRCSSMATMRDEEAVRLGNANGCFRDRLKTVVLGDFSGSRKNPMV